LDKARGACHRARIGATPPGTVYFKGGVWHMVEQNNPKRCHDTLARNPTGRMATPQEIANAAVFPGESGFLVHDRFKSRRRRRHLEPREFLRGGFLEAVSPNMEAPEIKPGLCGRTADVRARDSNALI
jgi:hypothetical protein